MISGQRWTRRDQQSLQELQPSSSARRASLRPTSGTGAAWAARFFLQPGTRRAAAPSPGGREQPCIQRFARSRLPGTRATPSGLSACTRSLPSSATTTWSRPPSWLGAQPQWRVPEVIHRPERRGADPPRQGDRMRPVEDQVDLHRAGQDHHVAPVAAQPVPLRHHRPQRSGERR